jgi:phenylacetate-CoA ligase
MRVPLAAPTAVGRQFLDMADWLEQSQWWTPETLRRHQQGLLERLLAHAHDTVPFYRTRLAAAGYRPGAAVAPEFWRSLPILRRGDLQDHAEAIKSTRIPAEHGGVLKIGTSGSTGRPVSVWRTDLQALILESIGMRKWFWPDCDLGLKFGAILRDAEGEAFPPAGRHYPDWGPPIALAYQTGPGALLDNRSTVAEIADWLGRERPDYLRTTSVVLKDLCFHFMDQGLAVPPLRGIQCSAEIVGSDLRALVRRVFGLEIAASYGAREAGMMAVQCPRHGHYHVQAETTLIEVLDDGGNPCATGETGTVVVTSLHGFATPLIRYEIGDRATVGPACDCGRPHPVLSEILGRTRDAVVLPSGERRYCYSGRGFSFWEFSDIRQFQIVQRSLYDLEVRLVARRKLTPEIEAEVARRVKAATSEHFAVGVTYHDAIPLNAGGKFQDFICEVDPKTAPAGGG